MTHTMTREEFYEFAADGIKGYIPEEYSKIEIIDVQNSRKKYKGLTAKKSDLDHYVSPVVNLDMFYDEYLDIVDSEKLFKKMADIVLMPEPDFKDDVVSYITDWEKVKNRLFVTVMNKEKVQTTVFRQLAGDLVMVARVMVSNKGGLASAVVTEPLSKKWEKDKETIIEEALNNSENVLGLKITSMNEMFGIPEDGPIMRIVTNTTGTQGASALFYPGVMKHIADDIIKGSYYVIPSSIHELIVIPDFGPTPEDLINMVKSVNNDVLETDDILSYSVFKYDINKSEFKEV